MSAVSTQIHIAIINIRNIQFDCFIIGVRFGLARDRNPPVVTLLVNFDCINIGAVTLSENKQLLKERLGAIMKFKEPSKAVKILTIMLTLFLAVGASFVGVYTAGTAQSSRCPVR